MVGRVVRPQLFSVTGNPACQQCQHALECQIFQCPNVGRRRLLRKGCVLEANIQQNHISFEALLLASPVPLPRRGNDLRRAETQGIVVNMVRRNVALLLQYT